VSDPPARLRLAEPADCLLDAGTQASPQRSAVVQRQYVGGQLQRVVLVQQERQAE
jgi:hypothetical protein